MSALRFTDAEKLRAQAIFNHVAPLLVAQAEISRNEDGSCRYRHGDLKCAVGHLITDEHYNPACESMCANDRVVIEQIQASGWIEEGDIEYHSDDKDLCITNMGRFLSELQGAHDGMWGDAGREDWERCMREFADEHELIMPDCSSPPNPGLTPMRESGS